MASICLGGIITLERTEAWPIASAPALQGPEMEKMKKKNNKNIAQCSCPQQSLSSQPKIKCVGKHHENQAKIFCCEPKKRRERPKNITILLPNFDIRKEFDEEYGDRT